MRKLTILPYCLAFITIIYVLFFFVAKHVRTKKVSIINTKLIWCYSYLYYPFRYIYKRCAWDKPYPFSGSIQGSFKYRKGMGYIFCYKDNIYKEGGYDSVITYDYDIDHPGLKDFVANYQKWYDKEYAKIPNRDPYKDAVPTIYTNIFTFTYKHEIIVQPGGVMYYEMIITKVDWNK